MSSVFHIGPKVRRASHAGSWYSDNPSALRSQLQTYLDNAPGTFNGSDTAPVEHARVIIAPHAGYRYSGPTAGVAYKAFALSQETKNVFVLGPSHHVYLDVATVSSCDELETPLGNLRVNKQINGKLQGSQLFGTVPKRDEEAEHSMEMHFPFVKLLIDNAFPNAPPEQKPQVVPIMIGNTSMTTEKAIGEELAPYLRDSTNVFVVSSDFAHWGRRFSYTYYVPKQKGDYADGANIRSDREVDPDTPIHESIRRVDDECMKAISTGHHELFEHALKRSHNTVCGRHPIGVMMAAIEVLKKELTLHDDLCRFVFTDYQRSGLVDDVDDSSVSYASAYAKVQCMDVLTFIEQIEALSDSDHGRALSDDDDYYNDSLDGSVFDATVGHVKAAPETVGRFDPGRSSSLAAGADSSTILQSSAPTDEFSLAATATATVAAAAVPITGTTNGRQQQQQLSERIIRDYLELDESQVRRVPSDDSMRAAHG